MARILKSEYATPKSTILEATMAPPRVAENIRENDFNAFIKSEAGLFCISLLLGLYQQQRDHSTMYALSVAFLGAAFVACLSAQAGKDPLIAAIVWAGGTTGALLGAASDAFIAAIPDADTAKGFRPH
jgi:hypothetical protein